MFTTFLRWFGSGQERPARTPGRLSFGLRLESLEGRATPGGAGPPIHGEEIPQVVAVSSNVAPGDDAIEVDPTGGGMVGSDFGVGVDLNGGHVSGGDFLYGVQVDPTSVPSGHGGEFGVGLGVDLNGCRGGLGGEV
jgi:hypothetical protein